MNLIKQIEEMADLAQAGSKFKYTVIPINSTYRVKRVTEYSSTPILDGMTKVDAEAIADLLNDELNYFKEYYKIFE